jgi:hypothetical protein
MSLTKTTTVDQITVAENGIILYREATSNMENDKELSTTYYRNSLIPGQDLINIPINVVAICNATWTAEVIAAYQVMIAEQQKA